jgi:hypothetical protein
MKPSKRTDILVTIAGLLGIVLFFSLYSQAFPSAALDLKLSRQQISQLAQETMRSYGYDLQGYKFALSFQQQSMASIYLQNTLGIPATNRLVQDGQVVIWYWHARWFKPLQKEEFSLDLAPDGRIAGFSHSIEEDRPAPACRRNRPAVWLRLTWLVTWAGIQPTGNWYPPPARIAPAGAQITHSIGKG